LTPPWLRRVLRYRRPVAAAAVGLAAVAALWFGAATQQVAGGIAAACGLAALGALDALWILPKRESETSTALREPHRGTDDALRDSERKQEIGRIAAGVAHDVNNMLQAIVGGLDLVIDEAEPDSRTRKFAGIALCAAMRGSRLTHHLLSYAGKQLLAPQAIAVADFLSELETQLARALGPHITIEVLVRDAPLVFADPGELDTALRAVAINAAEAMPQGGIIRIDARQDSADGTAWICIALTDTGTGMDAATLAQAVEPFFSTKEGGGLGLSMAHGFAEQSGGNLRITSVRGRGTTVELRLPAAMAANRLPAANDAGGCRLQRPLRQYG
jgi:signal transduction histidine kinase